ncbi:MAG: hypothetical protein ABIY47_13775 [Opitutaceae bacterium]
MNEREQKPSYAGPVYRTLSVLFALTLLGSSFYLLFGQRAGALQVIGALSILALGVNLLLAAVRGKESWLSKIGPLP